MHRCVHRLWRDMGLLAASSERALKLTAGVVLTAFASGMNYVAQSLYHDAYGEEEKMPLRLLAGHIVNVLSCGSVIVAYILYGLSGYKVYLMMQHFNVMKPLT